MSRTTINLADLEPQTREVEVPLSAVDRTQGTVHVTLRELPYAIKTSVELRYLAASRDINEARETLNLLGDGAHVEGHKIDEIGAAVGALRAAQLEVIKWGVVGHRAADFVAGESVIDYTSAPATCAGVAFEVASPRTLRLYQLLAPASFLTARSDLIANLSEAVLRYQRGEVLTPEEIWAGAEVKKNTQATATISPLRGASASTSDSASASSLPRMSRARKSSLR